MERVLSFRGVIPSGLNPVHKQRTGSIIRQALSGSRLYIRRAIVLVGKKLLGARLIGLGFALESGNLIPFA